MDGAPGTAARRSRRRAHGCAPVAAARRGAPAHTCLRPDRHHSGRHSALQSVTRGVVDVIACFASVAMNLSVRNLCQGGYLPVRHLLARSIGDVAGNVEIYTNAHLASGMLGVGDRKVGVLLHLPRHLHDPRLSPIVLQQLVVPLLQCSDETLRITINWRAWSHSHLTPNLGHCSSAQPGPSVARCKPAGGAGQTPPWRGRPLAP